MGNHAVAISFSCSSVLAVNFPLGSFLLISLSWGWFFSHWYERFSDCISLRFHAFTRLCSSWVWSSAKIFFKREMSCVTVSMLKELVKRDWTVATCWWGILGWTLVVFFHVLAACVPQFLVRVSSSARPNAWAMRRQLRFKEWASTCFGYRHCFWNLTWPRLERKS